MESKNYIIPTEVIHKELDLIQACIRRMADNSFSLKKWTVGLIGAVVALTSKGANMLLPCITLLVLVFMFWMLDAYYLRTERMYRKMYEEVIIHRQRGCKLNLYDLNPMRFKEKVASLCGVMFSKTLLLFS